MKLIVAPTDFSDFSLNAVNYAADLAASTHASLSIVHSCPLPTAFTEVPLPSETLTRLREDAEKQMQILKEKMRARTGGSIRLYTEIWDGMVIPPLRDYCEQVKPYAVVMSTQGAGAVERFLFGSNTIAAMKHLPWPLIVVPPDAAFKTIKKIGLACDMKNVVKTAPVGEIKLLVKEFGAELLVIHVNAEDEQSYDEDIINESGLLQEMIDELHPSYHFLNNTGIEEGLSDFAEKHKLDLLLVVPKKHNLISRIFHKSQAKKLVLHTNVPVMAVHE
jgi:nucleotide-binding universal stress UspA family protein